MFSEPFEFFQQIPPARPPHPIPHPVPVPYIARVGHSGRIAQWVAFVVFLLTTIILWVAATRIKKRHRAFHTLTATITGIAALSYYAMATNSGAAYVYQGHKVIQGGEVAVIKQIFWARYVDWALTTPLLLLALGLLAGLPWLDLITAVVAGEAMVITGLVAGFSRESPVKWGWYTFSWIFLLYVLYTLLWSGRQSARLQKKEISGLFTGLSIFIAILWIAYPVVFALTNTTRIVKPSVEAIAYAVLDILAKSVFGLWLVFQHGRIGDEDSVAALDDSWVEPRVVHHSGIHLPGTDNL